MIHPYSVYGNNAVIHYQRKMGRDSIDIAVDRDILERLCKEVRNICVRWDGPRRPVWRVAVTDYNDKSFYLARWITMAPEKMVVDHIDHDTLNNRKDNLRVVSFGENSWNRKGPDIDCFSGIRNVFPSRDGWEVGFRVNGKNIHAGRYSTIEEAQQLADSIRDLVYNGTWEKPKRIILRGQKMNKLNRDIHDRDGHRCVICGSPVDDGVKFHHVIFKSHGGDDSMENGVTLCNCCHTAVHGRVNCPDGEQAEYKALILEYLHRMEGING